MIIQKIIMKGFGKLNDREITLSDGLNLIYGENESGKSTVAEFIKAILYGIDSGVRDIRENERLHYTPLDGSAMGGSLEVTHEGKSYLITRTFGKTKGGDKLTIIDNVTGASVDRTPEDLIGLNRDSFMKTLYIKQLCTKVEGTKNDEILKKLINLSQTGEEEASYQNAKGLLNDALKELTSKAKGIIPKLNDEIAALQAERGAALRAGDLAKEKNYIIQSLKEEQASLQKDQQKQSEETLYREQYAQWSNALMQAELQEQLAKEQEENRRLQIETQINQEKSKQSSYLLLFAASALITLLSFLFIPLLAFIVPAMIFIFKYNKSKNKIRAIKATDKEFGKDACNNQCDDVKYKQWFLDKLGSDDFAKIPVLIEQYSSCIKIEQNAKNERMIQLAEKIRDMENEKNLITFRAVVAIDQDITMRNNQLRSYEAKEKSVKDAINALDHAFSELEQNFAPKLNQSTAAVLSQITEGRYQSVRADNIYHLTLTENTGNIIKADYLSSGTYDQIYFALRMGMIALLEVDAPIILDDAFAYYDDKRLEKAMDYLKTLKCQVLLFTCQNREKGDNVITL